MRAATRTLLIQPALALLKSSRHAHAVCVLFPGVGPPDLYGPIAVPQILHHIPVHPEGRGQRPSHEPHSSHNMHSFRLQLLVAIPIHEHLSDVPRRRNILQPPVPKHKHIMRHTQLRCAEHGEHDSILGNFLQRHQRTSQRDDGKREEPSPEAEERCELGAPRSHAHNLLWLTFVEVFGGDDNVLRWSCLRDDLAGGDGCEGRREPVSWVARLRKVFGEAKDCGHVEWGVNWALIRKRSRVGEDDFKGVSVKPCRQLLLLQQA